VTKHGYFWYTRIPLLRDEIFYLL